MRIARVWGMALVALCGMVAVARAESAVLKPLSTAEELVPEVVHAQSLVSTQLGEAGVRVLDAGEVKARLAAAANAPCLDMDCADSVLALLGADMLVAVLVGREQGRLVDVVVGMVDGAGHRVHGSERIGPLDLERATRAAFQRALSKWPARGLVPLRVSGSPEGASVLVDGQPRGVLPLELRLQPGAHAVSVTMGGYHTAERQVELASDPETPGELDVRLVRDPRSALRKRRAALGLMGAGGATLVVGALYTGFGFSALARDGECVNGHDVCAERYRFDGVAHQRLALGLTLSAAAVAAVTTGVILFVRERRAAQLELGAGPSAVLVGLRGQF